MIVVDAQSGALHSPRARTLFPRRRWFRGADAREEPGAQSQLCNRLALFRRYRYIASNDIVAVST